MRHFLPAPVLLAAVFVVGCGSSGSGGGDTMTTSPPAATAAAPAAPAGAAVRMATVDIKSFKYKPVTVTVK
jgi:hypothetical protein